MREIPAWSSPLDPSSIEEELLTADEPFVIRGAFADWPVVQASRHSNLALARYLVERYNGVHVTLFELAPQRRGRVFYSDESLSGFNFARHTATLDQVLKGLLGLSGAESPPGLYVGSTTVEAILPQFLEENPMGLGDRDALISLWLGNQTRIAAHYDLPDNLAVVASGRRRFTLFSPDQIHNLYMGPLEPTPAGQPVSLVDFDAPDFERFPRFRIALSEAREAVLEPGDAIFIPSMWFHHIEALEPINLLINAWWRRVPSYMDSPLSALRLALMTLRDLPEHERKIWDQHFRYFVFSPPSDSWEHIPAAARGLLGPVDEQVSRLSRTELLNKLKR
ncbi:MAG: hypothetical protein RLY30_486 [Pseudomonadota bacterium]